MLSMITGGAIGPVATDTRPTLTERPPAGVVPDRTPPTTAPVDRVVAAPKSGLRPESVSPLVPPPDPDRPTGPPPAFDETPLQRLQARRFEAPDAETRSRSPATEGETGAAATAQGGFAPAPYSHLTPDAAAAEAQLDRRR